jgi:triphosphoribosyl-dephospho-CoA synthase
MTPTVFGQGQTRLAIMGQPSLADLVETACLLEARARKPGNVHPEAAFVDTTYDDFVQSARCIAPIFQAAPHLSIGRLILDAVTATQRLLGKNTNLGIILLLAPLAKATEPTQEAFAAVLQTLTHEVAEHVYEAIRHARPGGLGLASEQDVHEAPTVTLLEAMRLAADRDLIARQYATAYHDVFSQLLPTLEADITGGAPLEQAIIYTHLTSIASLGDTLILRKCGNAFADEAQRRAKTVLTAWPHTPSGVHVLRDFDAWLRADGHRRNPGTTADLMAATLFLALRRGSIELPLSSRWECASL